MEKSGSVLHMIGSLRYSLFSPLHRYHFFCVFEPYSDTHTAVPFGYRLLAPDFPRVFDKVHGVR